MKTIEVVAGIIKYNDQILCMQRGLDKYNNVSYKWEFPGGKIEHGETKEEALIRELKEELEINVEIESYFTTVLHEYSAFAVNIHYFICKTNDKHLNMKVHNDYVWLNIDELSKLDWAPADKEVVDKLALIN